MATNPYEEASSSRARGGGRVWLVALAVAALVTTVAWAAPLGGQRPTAELSYGTRHIAPSDGRVTLEFEFPPVSLTGGYQAASGWLAYASSYSHGLM
ncbi:MAG: hypothetical protein UHS51_08600 [Atopobiaceae bacterium]|nr:hypothetical protein [Atopobiaceae bacterium]